jgi:hypothetical protein
VFVFNLTFAKVKIKEVQMFWRKKKVAEAPAEASPAATSATGAAPAVATTTGGTAAAKAEPEKMKKLPGPKSMPDLVAKYLIEKLGRSSDWVQRLMVVIRPNPKGEKAFDVRVYAPYEATEKRINVKNYATLDEHPELILFEGWFDKEAKQAELVEKGERIKVTILTKDEIRKKIEELSQPGSKVFFYLSASPASGGPLGRGAALVEVNPDYPGKGKKYIVSAVSVEGAEPTSKGLKMFDSNNPKDIAGWIKERHHNPYEQFS